MSSATKSYIKSGYEQDTSQSADLKELIKGKQGIMGLYRLVSWPPILFVQVSYTLALQGTSQFSQPRPRLLTSIKIIYMRATTVTSVRLRSTMCTSSLDRLKVCLHMTKKSFITAVRDISTRQMGASSWGASWSSVKSGQLNRLLTLLAIFISSLCALIEMQASDLMTSP